MFFLQYLLLREGASEGAIPIVAGVRAGSSIVPWNLLSRSRVPVPVATVFLQGGAHASGVSLIYPVRNLAGGPAGSAGAVCPSIIFTVLLQYSGGDCYMPGTRYAIRTRTMQKRRPGTWYTRYIFSYFEVFSLGTGTLKLMLVLLMHRFLWSLFVLLGWLNGRFFCCCSLLGLFRVTLLV